MSELVVRPPDALAAQGELTFNFAAALPGRASSLHTQRAYFRWVDQFLVDMSGLKPFTGAAREQRMSALPLQALQQTINAQTLRAWLGKLVRSEHGKQGLSQARAAIVTLGDLLAESELLDERIAATLARVRVPKAEDGQRPGRWLSPRQIKELIVASRAIATSDQQVLRNHVMLVILCTMALRRDELAAARWGDLSVQNDRPVMRVHGKGRKMAVIDIPAPVLGLLDQWRRAISAYPDALPQAHTPLIRRIYKGGRISKGGLTPDGIWLIVSTAAEHADIEHVAPHDLRRSVAGALNDAGVPLEKISRLLRHSNVAVTERYLSRLPKRNEGAVLMSDLLGLAGDWEDLA